MRPPGGEKESLAPEAARLRRDSLAAQAEQAILNLIDARGLTAGDALPSAASLAEELGVSRTVIREALSALSAHGIVRVDNGRTARVRALNPDPVGVFMSRVVKERLDDAAATLLDLRGPLEIRAAQLAARVIDEPTQVELRALIEEMGAAHNDADRYVDLDMRLHRRLAELSGNPALAGVLNAIEGPLRRAMATIRSIRERTGVIGEEHAEHQRIVSAVCAGDEAAATAAMVEHMDSVAQLVSAAPFSLTDPSPESDAS